MSSLPATDEPRLCEICKQPLERGATKFHQRCYVALLKEQGQAALKSPYMTLDSQTILAFPIHVRIAKLFVAGADIDGVRAALKETRAGKKWQDLENLVTLCKGEEADCPQFPLIVADMVTRNATNPVETLVGELQKALINRVKLEAQAKNVKYGADSVALGRLLQFILNVGAVPGGGTANKGNTSVLTFLQMVGSGGTVNNQLPPPKKQVDQPAAIEGPPEATEATPPLDSAEGADLPGT